MSVTDSRAPEQDCPELVVWAHRYAQAGLPVLPLHTPTERGCSCCRSNCGSVGKHPRVLAGKDDATRDVDQITRWWNMWPTANIGLVPPPGVIVLDVDPRNGGVASLLDIRARVGALPPTRSARTGSNGLHLWFAYGGQHGGRLHHRDEPIAGIDVKGSAGYLVAPPSRHASGQRYIWINQCSETPAPTWLRRMLVPPTPTRREGCCCGGDLDALARFVARAQHGNRNNALYWAACRAYEHHLDVNPLVNAAITTGQARASAEATVASAASARPCTEGTA